MNDTVLIDRASDWVVDNYVYNSVHLLQSLVWLDRLAPGSSLAVRLAVLTHDMERAFPGPDQPHADDLNDHQYYRLHATRSARIVGEWLEAHTADTELLTEVKALVQAHEFGGWHQANLVQAADSLSFLEVNIELFLDMVRTNKRPVEQVSRKFDWTFDRIQIPEARVIALPMVRTANAKLKALAAELSR